MQPTDSPLVQQWVTLLGKVLPCSCCRDSYNGFVQQLPSVVDVVRHQKDALLPDRINTGFFRWMYDLHNLVNSKLDRQHVDEFVDKVAGTMKCGEGKLRAALEQHGGYLGRRVEYDCVVKRYLIQPVAFCNDDVFHFLFITTMAPPASRDWIALWQLLPHVLQVAGGSPQLIAHIHTLATLQSTFMHSTQDQELATPDAFMQVMDLWARVNARDVRTMETESKLFYDRYLMAKADSCIKGSCV